MGTLVTQIIDDNSGDVTIYADIAGGGGDLSNVVVVDASALSPTPVSLSLIRVSYSFTSFTADLNWDATNNDPLYHLATATYEFDFSGFNGLPNPQSAGSTGDIVISTRGLGNQDKGSIVLELLKIS